MLNSWYSGGINPIYQTVTRIRFPHEQGHATGFFYNFDDSTYLVTNRHVVERQDTDTDRPESIRIFTRSIEPLTERDYHGISLTDGAGDDWYMHPLHDADIAVLPLDLNLDCVNHRIGIAEERPPQTGSLAYNEESILSQKDRVRPGNRSQIVGYPGHYVDHEHDFPVTRSSIVSSQYGLPYNGEPIFLTDARMHPGTSGSPVIAGPLTLISYNGIDLWGPAYKLLGVHSATLEQSTLDDDSRMLELNTAWYAELIEETLLLKDADIPEEADLSETE